MKEQDDFLEEEFNFSNAVKNPYAKALKKTITINLDENIIKYFKMESEKVGKWLW